jgi:hypothetical protein
MTVQNSSFDLSRVRLWPFYAYRFFLTYLHFHRFGESLVLNDNGRATIMRAETSVYGSSVCDSLRL